MTESLTSRVGRLITGSVNALVDALENASPETVMEQAVRELDGTIDDVRSELGKVIANKHLATKKLAEKNSAHEKLSQQIELAFSEKRDDLAEAAVSTQLDIEAQIPVLEQTIAECAESENELNGYINALQAKKREMRDDLKAFVDSRKKAPTGETGTEAAAPAGQRITAAAEKAIEAFDRTMETQTGVAGDAAPLANSKQLAELDALSRTNRVKERLAALKSQHSGS